MRVCICQSVVNFCNCRNKMICNQYNIFILLQHLKKNCYLNVNENEKKVLNLEKVKKLH